MHEATTIHKAKKTLPSKKVQACYAASCYSLRQRMTLTLQS